MKDALLKCDLGRLAETLREGWLSNHDMAQGIRTKQIEDVLATTAEADS